MITQTRKYINEMCLKDPTCAIFFKSMGFKDIKYDIRTRGKGAAFNAWLAPQIDQRRAAHI